MTHQMNNLNIHQTFELIMVNQTFWFTIFRRPTSTKVPLLGTLHAPAVVQLVGSIAGGPAFPHVPRSSSRIIGGCLWTIRVQNNNVCVCVSFYIDHRSSASVALWWHQCGCLNFLAEVVQGLTRLTHWPDPRSSLQYKRSSSKENQQYLNDSLWGSHWTVANSHANVIPAVQPLVPPNFRWSSRRLHLHTYLHLSPVRQMGSILP